MCQHATHALILRSNSTSRAQIPELKFHPVPFTERARVGSPNMARMVRSCMQSMLKLVNSVIGMVGMAMILYSFWMIKDWERRSSDLPDIPESWFIYIFLGLGISFCVITFFGHIAAETANGCCIYMYMFFICLILTMEAAVTADVLLNSHWEQVLIRNRETFKQLTEFVALNFVMCESIGLLITSTQGLCILFGLVLKALGQHPHYDSDKEFASENVPLLRDADGRQSDAWSIRINDKVKR
ncbi:hypothetical protein SAY87_011665 [Trapa incisa]|uniref:Tetraspanin-19 n=1 Tax=Trapa incisa TaxID=236973 RepID=A0AAN7GR46_9MYRT|nr:hypothetical protein SAY87_011665 [Trapa incisa]